MDLEQMKKVWEAYLEVQEGKKKLSPAQKKHFDKDNDGDIDDKDMAMLNKKEEVEVSEDDEQLDELSTTLVRRYKKKADAQTTAHMSKIDNRDPKNPKRPSAASDANFKKRMKGSNMAHDKLGGKYAKVPARKPTKEGVDHEEQLDELSPQLKQRAATAAQSKANFHSNMAAKRSKQADKISHSGNWNKKAADTHHALVSKETDHLAKARKRTAQAKKFSEANEPADPIKGAPARKGDKKKSDPMAKCTAGDPEKNSVRESVAKFTTFLEKVANEWPYKDEFNFKGKNKPAQNNEPLGQSKTDPNTKEYQDHNQSSTQPEGLVDKESPKSKEFIRQHQKSDKEFEVKYDQSVDDVSKAGADAVKSQSPNRRGTDNLKNGDMKPFKQAGKG